MSLRAKLCDEERLHGRRDIDVFMTNVSPPDKHGFCSFGPHMWNKKSYAQRAKVVIAEVDGNMVYPYRGDNFIHVSDVDYFVEAPTARVTNEELRKLVLEAVADEKMRQAWIDAFIMGNKHEPEYIGRAANMIAPMLNVISPEFFTGILGLDEP
jgi:acyl-CoA hydrolase